VSERDKVRLCDALDLAYHRRLYCCDRFAHVV
jgi:hypothetical protein